MKKDFITQANWLVWHRLTWDNDTKVAGRVLGSEYRERVADLNDGEAFVQTDWGADRVDRVQFRRKRTFDAGATPGLEDFDRPELKSVGENLVSELEEISAQEQRRQDRVAQLEAELEDRENRIDELEQKLESQDDIAAAATQMADALSNHGADTEADTSAPVSEVIEEKNRLERDLEAREDRIADLEREVESLREELADRPTLEDFETAREATERLADAFGVGTDGESGKWKRKFEAAQERIDELEATQPTVDVPDDYESFVDDEYVQEVIDEAKDEGSPRYVRAVVASILRRGGPVPREEIARDIDIKSDTNIEKGIKPLADRGIVTTDGTGPGKTIDFDLENVQVIHEQQARKERTEELMDQF
ncbi:hypothetical protein [Natronorubrum halophilum]|uniref:hypothetical protein n=1 Tax=Natronorubrum halophilum TaxID=1702106 RepID=UPI001EE91528|nr:hypothetical protein [Natronorubrum halophilum]